MKLKIIVIVILALLAIVGGVFYFLKNSKKVLSPEATRAKTEQSASVSLGAEVYGQAQNPLNGKVPETNPFKQEYKNPFE